ncbi:MAG: co-chaperone GroES [Solirubrobacteraceae bacterium]
MNEEIKPLGSRVLVHVLEEESVTRSGILLPDTAKEKPQRGEIVAVGDDEDLIKVSPGDTVLYPKYTGTEVTLDGHEHLILEATDLLAVIRTVAAPAIKAA